MVCVFIPLWVNFQALVSRHLGTVSKKMIAITLQLLKQRHAGQNYAFAEDQLAQEKARFEKLFAAFVKLVRDKGGVLLFPI